MNAHLINQPPHHHLSGFHGITTWQFGWKKTTNLDDCVVGRLEVFTEISDIDFRNLIVSNKVAK